MTTLDDIFGEEPAYEETGELLLPLLRKQMEVENKRYVKEPKIRASSIGGCPRFITYMLTGYEEQKTAKDVITLELGTVVHEILQKYIANIPGSVLRSLEQKVMMDSSEDAAGSYDGELVINGERFLLEIKTMNAEAYQRMILYRKIYTKYKHQANFYMNALGIKKTIFIFVNKSGVFSDAFQKEHGEEGFDPILFEMVYYADPKIVKEIQERVIDITNHMKNGTRPPYKLCSQCSYCAVKDRCKAEWKEEKAATKPPKETKPRRSKNV
jgi:hypothetical protein